MSAVVASPVAQAAAGHSGERVEVAALSRSVVDPRQSVTGVAGQRTPLRRTVLAAVEKWRRDWERLDVDAYLGNYVRGVSPHPARSRADWEQERRERLQSPNRVSITLSDVAIARLGPALAEVEVTQRYESDRFSDEVKKSLSLMLTREGWRIRHERVIATVD